jgi:hypothetical protein
VGLTNDETVPEFCSWTLADILDFEALLHLDEQADPKALAERDRGVLRTPDESRSNVFHRWLETRRKQGDATVLPGTWLVNGLRILGGIAATAGLVLGFSAAMAALYYSGAKPVNVAMFLAVTVFIQWVLLFWAFLVWACRGFRRSAARALTRMTSKLGSWLAGAMDHLPGDQRMRLHGEAAALRNLAGRNGELLGWPPILALQGFGVMWNVGVLAALLLRVLFTDVAFGWESTWAKGPETAHAIARALALPWSWFAPNACPTMEQVEKSWFHYLSGAGVLDRAATVSWWPWLVGVVLVYGLAVRLILLLWARWSLARALKVVDFHEPRHLAPWLRIGGRLIESEAPPTADYEAPATELKKITPTEAAPACLLVDRSIASARESLEQWVHTHLGWRVVCTEMIEADFPSGNDKAIQRIAAHFTQAPRWLVVLPAPFTTFAAIAQFLTTLRQSEPSDLGIERGVLVVSHDTDGRLAAPSPEWVRYWRDFLRAEFPHAAMIDWRTS